MKKLLSLILLLLVGTQSIAFGATKAEPLFNKADYLPNNTEAQIEANSMKWFEERVKYVKENIKMLPDDFMENWSWEKPLTRMDFLVLTTPVRSDEELKLFQSKEPKLYKDIAYTNESYEQYYTNYEYSDMKGDHIAPPSTYGWILFSYVSKETPTKFIRPYDYINFAETSKTIITTVMRSESSGAKGDFPPDKYGKSLSGFQWDERKKNEVNTTQESAKFPWYFMYTSMIENMNATPENKSIKPSKQITIKDFSRMMFQTLMIGSNYADQETASTFYVPNWGRVTINCSQIKLIYNIPVDQIKHNFYCTK